MDLDQLRALVAGGESERLEFKKSTGELKEGVQSLCAFLNGKGGQVLFGVTASGRIVGQMIADSTLRDVAQELSKLEPQAAVSETRVPIGGSVEVLVLEVGRHSEGPCTYNASPISCRDALQSIHLARSLAAGYGAVERNRMPHPIAQNRRAEATCF